MTTSSGPDIKSVFNNGHFGRGVYYDDVYEGLVLDGDALWDEEITGNIDTSVPVFTSILTQGRDELVAHSGATILGTLSAGVGAIDFVGNRVSSGEYELSSVLDLGGKFAVNLEGIINNNASYISDYIDDRTALVDIWVDWDGEDAEDTDATLYFRASDDAKAEDKFQLEADSDLLLLEDGSNFRQELSVAFGDWRILQRNTFVGRTFQFKIELETENADQTPVIDELGVLVSLPSRTERSDLIDSGAAAKEVTFTNAFYRPPTVGIAAFNLLSGDYYEVTSVTRTGFTVHFKDSSNSSVDRKFEYAATGFGSEQT